MNRITLITLTMAMTAWLGTTAEGTDKAMPASAVPSLSQNASAINILSDGSPVFDELVKKGKDCSDRKDYEKALSIYRSALSLAPAGKKGDLYCQIGFVQKKMHRYEEARMALEEGLRLSPKNWKILYALGNLYSNPYFNRQDIAEKYYTMALETSDNKPKVLVSWGAMYLTKGNEEKAIEKLSKSISLDPSYGKAYVLRGSAYGRLKKYKEAFDDYDAFLAGSPERKDLSLLYGVRGTTLFSMGKYEQAADDFLRLQKEEPDQFYPNSMAGQSLYKCKQYEKAIPYLKKAAEIKPNAPIIWDTLGMAYDGMKQPRSAQETLEKAVSLGSDSPLTYLQLSHFYRKRKDYPALARLDTAFIEKNPKSFLFYQDRAYALEIMGKYEEAISDFNAAIDLGLDIPDIHLERGLCYLKIGDPEKALADFKAAEEQVPQDQTALLLSSVALGRMKEYDRALSLLVPASLLPNGRPKNRILNTMGSLYALKGDYERAITILTDGIRQYPAYPETYRSRACVYEKMGHPDMAISDMNEFLKRQPQNIRGLQYRAKLLEETGKHDLAEKDRRKVADLEKKKAPQEDDKETMDLLYTADRER